jgi:hypothetical protein
MDGEVTMKLLQRILLATIGFFTMIGSVMAGVLPYRPNATVTLANISEPRLVIVNNLWGGFTNTTSSPNWGLLIYNGIMVYQDSLGQIVWVIIFAIPFIMMFIAQADMTMAAIVGMIFSLYIFAKLPAPYITFVVGCFCVSIAALLWSLYKRAY